MNVATEQQNHQHRQAHPEPNTYVCVNGRSQTNQGYRQVAFDPDGHIRPVFSAERAGKLHERHTKQSAKEGDFILRFEWYPVKWKLLTVKEGKPIDLGALAFGSAENRAIISRLPVGLDAWLEAKTMEASYLPEGCGWDGFTTLADQRKEENIRRFFNGMDEEALDTLVASALICPIKYLPTRWNLAHQGIPDTLDCPKEIVDFTDGEGYDIINHRYTQWVLWYDDGRVDFLEPEATDGNHTRGGIVIDQFNALPFTTSKRVRKAAKITRNALETNGRFWGVSWELYVRPRHLHRH